MPHQARTSWARATSGTVRAATQQLPTIELSSGTIARARSVVAARPAAADNERSVRRLPERQALADVLEQMVEHDGGPPSVTMTWPIDAGDGKLQSHHPSELGAVHAPPRRPPGERGRRRDSSR